MLAANKLIGFVPTRDALKARILLGQTRFPVPQRRPVRPRHESRRNLHPNRPGQGFHAGSIYRHGLGGLRYRSRGQAAYCAVFEKYSFVQNLERGIWTTPGGDKVAWFQDPDGNVLSVSQPK
jgi:hypothetical protein